MFSNKGDQGPKQDLKQRSEQITLAERRLYQNKLILTRMLIRQSIECLSRAQELLNEQVGDNKDELISPPLNHKEPPHLI